MRNPLKWRLFAWLILPLFTFPALAQDVHALVILSDEFGPNYYFNRDDFDRFGWRITTAGITEQVDHCSLFGGLQPITVDSTLDAIQNIRYYDVVMIAPSSWRTLGLDVYGDIRSDSLAMDLITKSLDSNLVLALHCGGPLILDDLDRLQGVSMVGTAGPQMQFIQIYEDAGANFLGTDHPPVIHENIVTGVRDQFYNNQNAEAVAIALERTGRRPRPVRPFVTETIYREGVDWIQWESIHGSQVAETASTGIRLQDGKLAVIGTTWGNGSGESDVLLVVYEEDGGFLWERTYGSAGFEVGSDLIQTSAGDLLITGYATDPVTHERDVLLIKTDATGDTLWAKHFGGDGIDVGQAVREAPDGNLVLVATTTSQGSGEDDIWILKLDPEGTLIWDTTLGGYRPETATDLELTESGIMILGATGTPLLSSSNQDVYLARLSYDGILEWEHTYGNPINAFPFDWGNDLVPAGDGSFYIIGSTNYSTPLNVYLLKVDGSGTLQWQRNYGGPGHDYGKAGVLAPNGDLIIAGTYKQVDPPANRQNDFYCIRVDSTGATRWERQVGGSGFEWCSDLIVQEDGYVLVGQTDSEGAGSWDISLVKIVDIEPEFNFSPNTGHAPVQVEFHDASLGAITGWSWDFNGDGITDAEGRDPTWTYEVPGTYDVTLTVTGQGLSRTYEIPDSIRVFDGESALLFDGAQAQVRIPATPEMAANDAFCLEAWIHASDWGGALFGGLGRIMDKSKLKLYLVDTIPNFNHQCLVLQLKHEEGGNSYYMTPRSSMSLNQPHHVAASFDAQDAQPCLYIDGLLQPLTQIGSGQGILEDHSQSDLYIGMNATGTTGFVGVIDIVRYWNRARSAQQIEAYMNAHILGPETGLIGSWAFNEGVGDSTTDDSGFEHHGIVQTAEWVQGAAFEVMAYEKTLALPQRMHLGQAYPNPFNAVVRIPLSIAAPSHVEMRVYDLSGRHLAQIEYDWQVSGNHQIKWDGVDAAGHPSPSGIYLYSLQVGPEPPITGRFSLIR